MSLENTVNFDYANAFSRNQGLIPEGGSEKIKDFRICIAGMGGVGGIELITLARMGFEKFNIADGDSYELVNFNRQYGAKMDTIGKSKVDVMYDEVKKINPNADVNIFPYRITREVHDDFFKDVNYAVDGIDAFAVEDRRDYFNGALERGIVLTTAAPIGYGTAVQHFVPGGPNFDEFYGVTEDTPRGEKLASFFSRLTPHLFHLSYMNGLSINKNAAPSSPVGVSLAAGAVAESAVRLATQGEKSLQGVPYYTHIDLHLGKFKHRKMAGPNHPWSLIRKQIALKKFEGF